MGSKLEGQRRRSRALRHLRGAAAALALLVGAPGWGAAATQDGLTIPTSHPRIWWTPERLVQAKQWYAQNPFTPSSGDALGNAFRYLMTGEATYAQRAITLLMGFTVPESELSSVASDTYRWNDWPPVVFDWTYDVMTPSDRTTFIDRYNRYVDIMRQKSWGGPGLEANNYYWGYWRNELNWAVASYHHSAMAPTFLDHALVTRWANSFLPYAAGGGKGGVPQEGTQYGRYLLGYPVIPMTTAGLLGRDLLGETNFYKEAICYLIYATTPAPTRHSGGEWYEFFPFNDDEVWLNGWTATNAFYGEFMRMVSTRWRDLPVGQYARRWLNVVNPSAAGLVKAVDPGGAERPWSELPLDYYAPGGGFLYARTAWSPQTTATNFQLGVPSRIGHAHLDAGTFQIWRNRQWLTRETVGYSDSIAGYGGGAVDTSRPVAHNSVLFNGLGQANAYAKGPPKIKRLESRANYTYANVDLSDAYRAVNTSNPTRDDNPYASHVEREFVFVRPLETLVILDRMESSSEKVPAGDVVKTFLVHFEKPPTIQGPNSVVGVNGDQALRVTTLLPSTPSYRVVYEGSFTGSSSTSPIYQHRLEVDTKGQPQSTFLNVLQAKDALGSNVDVQFADGGATYTVTLQHPTAGTAVLIFNKGLTATGGQFGYSPSGFPSVLTPFIDRVQGIEVTGLGPVWEGVSMPSGSDTVPPSVALTAPAEGSVVTGTVAVNATASDDLGVVGVQFKVDGANLGNQDLTAPYSIPWNTPAAADGLHTLTAVATDVAGKQATSSAITVTVSNAAPPPPPVDPVYLYVEAESGSILSAFQEGQDGNASRGAYLTTPANIPILTSGQTEVRVGVTVPAGGSYYLWARILGPSDDQDALYAGFDGTFDRIFPDSINTYQWVRVETINGSGTVAHQLIAGLHQITIGHAEPQARLDVLLVTNDPTFIPTGAPNPTPIPPADVTAPTITNIQVSLLTTTSVRLSWTTDEPSDSVVRYGTSPTTLTQAYKDSTLVTSHEAILSDLNRRTTYSYQILATDAAGNEGQSAVLSFTTPKRLAKPPSVTNLQARAGSVILSWNNPQYEFTTAIVILRRTDRFPQVPTELPAPLATLTGLSATSYRDTEVAHGTTYYYSVFTIDDQGTASDPATISFTPNHSPIADAGADQATTSGRSIQLDGRGSTDPDGDALTYAWSRTAGPTVTLSGASAATASFAAPTVQTSTDFVFTLTVSDGTLSATDTVTVTVMPEPAPTPTPSPGPNPQPEAATPSPGEPPVITELSLKAVTHSTLTLLVTTDRLTRAHLDYGSSMAYSQTAESHALSRTHTFTVNGLVSGSLYYFRVTVRDVDDEVSAASDRAFATLEDQDLEAPGPVPDLVATDVSDLTASLAWTASGDDGNRGTVTAYEVHLSREPLATAEAPFIRPLAGPAKPKAAGGRERLVLDPLVPSTVYFARVRARDECGTWGPWSNEAAFTTRPPIDRQPPILTDVRVTELDTDRVTIIWRTNELAGSQVDFGIGPGTFERTIQDGGLAGEHRVVLAGLKPSTRYFVRLGSADAAGNAAASEGHTFVTLAPDTTPPSAPGNLRVAERTPNSMRLAWDAATDDRGGVNYQVRRGDVQIEQTPAPTCAERDLRPGATYTYTVVAIDGAGNRSTPATVTVTLEAPPPPPVAPDPPKAVRVQTDLIRLDGLPELQVRWTTPEPTSGWIEHEILGLGEVHRSPATSLGTTHQVGFRVDTRYRNYTLTLVIQDSAGRLTRQLLPPLW